MRVLLTGSRTWTRPRPIWDALDAIHAEHPDMVLVHGACPTGVDLIGDTWACERGVRVDRHFAQWLTFGRAAGPIRNGKMVRSGIDLCLAFVRDNSRGTSNCVQLAQRAGIETRIEGWVP